MMPWSRNWLSSVVRRDAKVNEALTELLQLIRLYEDAAKPSCCRESASRLPSAALDCFRPGWKLFAIVSFVCGVAGVLSSSLVLKTDAVVWVDLAITVTVPVFVLGVSVVTLARSMSESGRFAVEYLNESCRMDMFCWLTLVAVLIALVARFLITLTSLPAAVAVGLCAAALGAAVDCLAMLAFVVRETIRCSLPVESVRVVSQYAARRLCQGYLKEAYIRLSMSLHKDFLEKWCTENCGAIHPPSQYYGHYFRSHHGEGDAKSDCEIKLEGSGSGTRLYKDFCLERLTELDRYLKENGADLYLSSHEYESENGVLGTLSSAKAPPNDEMKAAVQGLGKQAVRLRRLQFEEESDDFWDSQQNALNEAIERAVSKADPIQVRAYLDAVNKPLTVLGQTRRHKVVRDAYGEHIRRGYDFLRLYLAALHEILAIGEHQPKHRTGNAFALGRVLLKSVLDETQKLCEAVDYHTMKLFTWLVEAMYKTIHDAEDKAGPLRGMRARFGGFYTFVGGQLEHSKSADAEAIEEMRLALHEGLTKWLLVAIEERDDELVEQLCDTDRGIVFGRKGIAFDQRELTAQHFVLAGHLMRLAEAGDVKAQAVERLFCKAYSHGSDVDFDDLVTFYLGQPFPPPQTLGAYLDLFYMPKRKHEDLLTGGSRSSGCGMTGVREMALAFVYLAAFTLADSPHTPDPIAKDLSHRISDDAMNAVRKLFNDPGLNCGLKALKAWRDRGTELENKAEAKEIAEAKFDPEKVEQWSREFWEAYSRSSPVLSMCLKNGNYEIDDASGTKRQCDLPKIAVIDWRYPIAGADGNDYGRPLGQSIEEELLNTIAEKAHTPAQVEGGLSEAVATAVGWLAQKGCSSDAGIVIVKGMHSPTTELSRDERFLPSWREDVRSKGFDGFYDGFPVVWLRKKDEEDDNAENSPESARDQVIAVDLSEWKGIKVRECVVAERKFGDIEIRTWTEKEINKALESDKLKQEDVDKAKGNCPVEVSLFWQFSTDDLPPARVFEFGSAGEKESATH